MRWRGIVAALAATATAAALPVVSSAEAAASNDDSVASAAAPAVQFEPNEGQHHPSVRFYGRGAGLEAFLTADGATTYVVPDRKRPERAAAVRMRLVGGDAGAATASDPQPGVVSYFRGADPARWHTGIPTFGRVELTDVLPGIDLVHRGNDRGELEYDLVVAPGASPDAIELTFDGVRSLRVTPSGALELRTDVGALTMAAPVLYQPTDNGNRRVDGAYKVQGRSVRFTVGSYDASQTLVIDPAVTLSNLAFSTLLGGVSTDRARGVAVDGAGNVIVVGQTFSTLFPTTPGTFDRTLGGTADAFIAKVNSSGSALIYSTVIGGASTEELFDVTIDGAGNAVAVGTSQSSDFPTTAGAADTIFNGSSDGVVVVLHPTGTSLVLSTYLGGSGGDSPRGVTVDGGGRVLVAGVTSGGTFPVTAGAFDTTHNGANDAFVTAFAAGGASLAYSTFLGGDGSDTGTAIAVDATGHAFVSGFTSSTAVPFPTTPGALDTSHNGSNDAFVAKLSPAGDALLASTFIGGASSDAAFDVAVDRAGDVYVAGFSGDGSYPTIAAFDPTHNGSLDFVLTKLAPTLSSLRYSTFLGGSGIEGDFGVSLAVDDAGSAYIAGNTTSGDIPTANAFDASANGSDDAAVFQLSPSGTQLRTGTYLGGQSADLAFGVAVDAAGNVYVTGHTSEAATNFPVSDTAFQPYHNGSADAFVTKLGDFAISGRVLDEHGAPVSGMQVSMSGPVDGVTTTDAQGWWTFADTVLGESFVVTPEDSRANPSSYTVSSLTRNHRVNFFVDFQAPFGDPGTVDGRRP